MLRPSIRLHLPAIPHTITHDDFSHCAFTGKVLRFSPMMRSKGFEVYHYGIESSESGADKQIDLMTRKEWQDLRVFSYKELHPDKTDAEVEELLSSEKSFVGDLANVSTMLYTVFNKRFREELQKHYRAKHTDIVCIPFGKAYQEALQGLSVVEVETGIGYPDSYAPYRIFESYAQMHFICGKENINQPFNYWFVVPNYYNIKEWSFNQIVEKPRVGFFGRICHIKGLNVFVEVAKRFPEVEFVMCGQGDEQPYMDKAPNLNYLKPLSGKDRCAFLSSLSALICPSLYIEPFCGVNVEAQLCGTPVICNHFGAFSETVEHGKTGLWCHTLADFCHGVQMALNNEFDRKYIRDRAVKKYDMFQVASQYEYAFRCVLDLFTYKNGWYSEDDHIAKTFL